MNSFRDILLHNTPLLFDGAMGTELYNKGVFLNRCFEEINLSNPSIVHEIHESYLKAGAKILTTNSWGANPHKLAAHNLQDKIETINTAAVSLARDVAKGESYVAGSMGPLGLRLEPWGETSRGEARELFRTQAAALLGAGVDLIILETFGEISEIEQAVLAVRDVDTDIPLIGSLSIGLSGNTTFGTPLDLAARQLDAMCVDVVGLNCSVGPQIMLDVLPKMKLCTTKPLMVQPNAGMPRNVGGRSIYLCSPEYMAEFAKLFLREGVQFVGGCCGTTSEHIKMMANALRQRKAMLTRETVVTGEDRKSAIELSTPEFSGMQNTPFELKSKFSAKIARKEKVYSVELLPPCGVNTKNLMEHVKVLKNSGIDVINIPDGPRASARMSAPLTAVMIEKEVGIETILHYTCRDRNLLGMQSDMLGLYAIGIRNLLLITGDPPKLGNYPNATGVFDIDSIGLTNMVHRLNSGFDLGGRKLDGKTEFSFGVGVNPVALDFEYEMKRFFYKVDAGAEWAITQPVFDIATFYRFLNTVQSNNLRIPIIAGIWPLVSYRNAEFLNNEVPGISIPRDIIERMKKAKTPEDARKVGIEIAQTMMAEMEKDVSGFAVSAPFGKIEMVLDILRH